MHLSDHTLKKIKKDYLEASIQERLAYSRLSDSGGIKLFIFEGKLLRGIQVASSA